MVKTKKCNHHGFSLVELIIVIAIMAALTAILAPQYIKYVDKSRAVVCQHNLDEAARAYYIETVSSSEAPSQLMDGVVAGMGAKRDSANVYSGLCPSGGKVTVTYSRTGIPTLTCSKHPENVSIMQNPTDALSAAVSGAGINMGKGTRIDSTAITGANRDKLLQQLEEAGFSLTGANISSWALVNTSDRASASASGSGAGMLYLWSSYDVSAYATGDQVPVICYNATTGKYTVGMTNVAKSPSGPYNIIGQSAETKGFGSAAENNSKNFESYDEALAAYQLLTPNRKDTSHII